MPPPQEKFEMKIRTFSNPQLLYFQSNYFFLFIYIKVYFFLGFDTVGHIYRDAGTFVYSLGP